MSGRELYVYYRVRSVDVGAAAAEIEALQRDLMASVPGLMARLLRRPGEADGLQTWMEIYARDAAPAADGIDAALQAAIEARAADALTHVVGTRHVEVFVACAS